MKKFLIILVVIAGLIGFGVWKLTGVVSKGGKAADDAVATFHIQFNEGKDEEILKGAASGFQKTVTLEKLKSEADFVRTNLGKFVSADRTGTNVNTNNGDTTLTVEYAAKYEKGPATESFVFDYNTDKALLLGFDIKSASLPVTRPATGTAGVPEVEKK